MTNIEQLEAENEWLKSELLQVKREILETSAIEAAFHDRDIKELTLRLTAVGIMGQKDINIAYQKIITANNVLKDSLGLKTTKG